jgi:hypothetical protein
VTVHHVKSWTYLFSEIVSGNKLHDIRDMTERDYKIDDALVLEEFDPIAGLYTGRCQHARITYITDRATPCAFSSAVLKKGFGILSIKKTGFVMDMTDEYLKEKNNEI